LDVEKALPNYHVEQNLKSPLSECIGTRLTNNNVSGDMEDHVQDSAAEERQPAGGPEDVGVDEGKVNGLASSEAALRSAVEDEASVVAV
jgi:hypothetical protein